MYNTIIDVMKSWDQWLNLIWLLIHNLAKVNDSVNSQNSNLNSLAFYVFILKILM